jgi:hypothetical protein
VPNEIHGPSVGKGVQEVVDITGWNLSRDIFNAGVGQFGLEVVPAYLALACL